MSIDRDDCDERQARIDLMINEFREAQKRRYLNRNDKAVDSQLEATTKVPLSESTTSHDNGASARGLSRVL